jgi:hypothetical protein
VLARFSRYLEKVFDFGQLLATVRDSRSKPQIPATAIWGSAFAMAVLRSGSLNAIESALRLPRRLEKFVGPVKPSADTVGRVAAQIDPEILRAMLCKINHRLGRNKIFPKRWPLRFVAVDGHEFFSQQTPLLSGLQSAHENGQWLRGDRVLPPGSGLPPRRL